MTFTVIDHGTWELYVPNPLPEWAQGNVLPAAFARRTSDGVDWYAFRNNAANFAKDSIVCTVLRDPSDGVETVKAVFRDETMIFPGGSRLIEVLGVDPADPKPHDVLAWMIYDPINRVLLPPAPPPVPALTFKKDIWVRATDEEAETIEQVLSQQSLRKQRIYAEAQYLDHADPLYGELYAGFVQAFGKERADQLLAGP
ncbi:hypothetical protein ACN9MF_17820 [Methylobacterium fujisawaense]|uniref:hypothetical protein n=1 Tax=Methylobacterium fujisawaense TaxID=107400 RepID=UPI003CF2EF0E